MNLSIAIIDTLIISVVVALMLVILNKHRDKRGGPPRAIPSPPPRPGSKAYAALAYLRRSIASIKLAAQHTPYRHEDRRAENSLYREVVEVDIRERKAALS